MQSSKSIPDYIILSVISHVNKMGFLVEKIHVIKQTY